MSRKKACLERASGKIACQKNQIKKNERKNNWCKLKYSSNSFSVSISSYSHSPLASWDIIFRALFPQ